MTGADSTEGGDYDTLSKILHLLKCCPKKAKKGDFGIVVKKEDLVEENFISIIPRLYI